MFNGADLKLLYVYMGSDPDGFALTSNTVFSSFSFKEDRAQKSKEFPK